MPAFFFLSAPMSKDGLAQQKLQRLLDENLPYDEYQLRYRALVEE